MLVTIATVSVFAFLTWAQICNYHTLVQRRQMIDRLFTGAEWRVGLEVFRGVSYGRHLLYLIFFLNPSKLYQEHMLNPSRVKESA